jgi:molybdenum ABC transporter molybdate-binding protein
MKRRAIIAGVLVAAAVLAALPACQWEPRTEDGASKGENVAADAGASESPASGTSQKPLILYCAAGTKPPVEAAVREYEKEYGVQVQLQYGGSGTLLSNLQVARSGDLFLAGDESYIRIARGKGLLAEAIPLSRMTPVIAVAKGNPKGIRTLEDLCRDGVSVALANPGAASIGRTVQQLLQKDGTWTKLEKHAKVFKPTVSDVANDVKIGTVDAGIVWDATARQYPELEIVSVPALDTGKETVTIGVLSYCQQPAKALRLARYLGAKDRGLTHFEKLGYEPVDGDEWAERPEIVLYSGAMNRVAIKDTLAQFEQREGIRLTTVFNGCGILVGQMKAGGRPDAYLTCDRSFVPPVEELFVGEPAPVSETDIVILTKKGNPKGIQSLADLGQSGLRVGVANPKQSTLGALTEKLLKEEGLFEKVKPNVRAEKPTADMLVGDLQIGTLDAVVVYDSNASQVRDKLDTIAIDKPGKLAVQTFSVGKGSKYKQTVGRLFEALRSAESRERYQAAGFRWKGPAESEKTK